MDYKSYDYWKRRLKSNTAPLPPGEMKMLFLLFLDTIEELKDEVEHLRSKGAAKPSKKLGPQRDTAGDA